VAAHSWGVAGKGGKRAARRTVQTSTAKRRERSIPPPAASAGGGAGLGPAAAPGGQLRAVLFDVDFTLARPGPELGPEGYEELGRAHGLGLEPERYAEARAAAIANLERHPDLDHDEEIWVRFTVDIVRGMGGDGPNVGPVAREIVRRWEHAYHFELYDDALPVLAELRRAGLKLGLVSNTSRDLDAFVRHFGIDVDAWISSGAHGKVKPSPLIFAAALDLLGVRAEDAVMVGDSPEDDVEGARAAGLRAILLDRAGRFPEHAERIESLRELPARLGL
jgi:putative hydrolase of the HAD superfamily